MCLVLGGNSEGWWVVMALWSRVAVTDAGCWEWQGHRNEHGYGRVSVGGRRMYAHRLAYLATHFVIPEGLVVMHRCDNPPCVNPDHLAIGTYADNTADMIAKGRSRLGQNIENPFDVGAVNRAKTHCPAGHAYAVNAYLHARKDRPGRVERICLECVREFKRRRRARLREEAVQ